MEAENKHTSDNLFLFYLVYGRYMQKHVADIKLINYVTFVI